AHDVLVHDLHDHLALARELLDRVIVVGVDSDREEELQGHRGPVALVHGAHHRGVGTLPHLLDQLVVIEDLGHAVGLSEHHVHLATVVAAVDTPAVYGVLINRRVAIVAGHHTINPGYTDGDTAGDEADACGSRRHHDDRQPRSDVS